MAPHTLGERTRTAWAELVVVLLVGGPLHVAMAPTADASIYDVQARTLAEGGMLYRDVVEPNLPGAPWIHLMVRTFLGPGSEVLRLFDLLVFGAIVALLASFVRAATGSVNRAVWTSSALFVCYFSLSEWCHCQRDVWMLLPALVAIHVRRSQDGTQLLRSLLEGMLWGVAFWLKPHVALPALAVMVVSWRRRTVGVAVRDACGVLAGGLIVGAAGAAWLVVSGTWPWFWEMLVKWNPEYVAIGRERWTWGAVAAMGRRTFPWLWLHVAAVPVAVRWVVSGPREEPSDARSEVAAAYLVWLAQALLLQRPFDYVQVPPILLAIALLGSVRVEARERSAARFVVAAFAAIVVSMSPLFRLPRLACWPRAVAEGSTPEVRDRLAVLRVVGWRELAEVTRFLDEAGVGRDEVIAYSGHLVHLHAESGFDSPTRFVYLHPLVRCFPSRLDQIAESLDSSGARYVVSSMIEGGLPPAAALAQSDDPHTAPPAYDPPPHSFPWSHPVVFRSGRYLVHRIEGHTGELGIDLVPLDDGPRREDGDRELAAK